MSGQTYYQPTAWQSLPGAVRFVIWLWTISVLVSFALAVLGAVVTLFAMVLGVALW